MKIAINKPLILNGATVSADQPNVSKFRDKFLQILTITLK